MPACTQPAQVSGVCASIPCIRAAALNTVSPCRAIKIRFPFVEMLIFALIPQDIAGCKSNRLALGVIMGKKE
jgi:hypothetical protein